MTIPALNYLNPFERNTEFWNIPNKFKYVSFAVLLIFTALIRGFSLNLAITNQIGFDLSSNLVFTVLLTATYAVLFFLLNISKKKMSLGDFCVLSAWRSIYPTAVILFLSGALGYISKNKILDIRFVVIALDIIIATASIFMIFLYARALSARTEQALFKVIFKVLVSYLICAALSSQFLVQR